MNPKTLTASIVGNPTKPYDGNANATLTPANFSLSGLVGNDSFTVTKTTGTYNSADVATATTVTTSLVAGDFLLAGHLGEQLQSAYHGQRRRAGHQSERHGRGYAVQRYL